MQESPTELGVPAPADLVSLFALGHFLIKKFYFFGGADFIY